MFTEDVLREARRPIAVVGNARMPHAFGRLIDRYGTVIRLNNYRIEGYQERVGTRTDYRCVSGWRDVENRNERVELSPFTAGSDESAGLARYNARNDRAVVTAGADVHMCIPEVNNPSTGFALVQLFNMLQIPVDLFGFDGFRTGHYWDERGEPETTHSRRELDYILARDNVLLFGDVYDYREVYDFCHREHAGYDNNVGVQIARQLEMRFENKRILEFGAGNGELASQLEADGNHVTAVEISKVAWDRIRCRHKINGGTLALPLLDGPYDLFLSIDVLEHLTTNDIKMVVRQAARLCKEILVTVSTRPSGLLGPRGENLHLTVRPPGFWQEIFSSHFDVEMYEGFFDRQYILLGSLKAGVEHEAEMQTCGSATPA